MKDIAKLALRLIVITVVAGLLLGLTYNVTKDPIAQQQVKAESEARMQVLSEAESFEAIDLSAFSLPEEYAVIDEAYKGINAGNMTGVTVNLTVTGYAPGLNITVGINLDGTVSGVKINAMSETPGLGAKANDSTYLSQYLGKTAPITIVKSSSVSAAAASEQSPGESADVSTGQPENNEVVAITGATITSKAVANAVNLAVQFYNDYVKEVQ